MGHVETLLQYVVELENSVVGQESLLTLGHDFELQDPRLKSGHEALGV